MLPQIGLVEQEWLATLATINAEEVTFTDYVDKGRELATSLKNEVSSVKSFGSLGFMFCKFRNSQDRGIHYSCTWP